VLSGLDAADDRLTASAGENGGAKIAMIFRVLGPHERGRFAPEAWGHLLALSGSGALNAAELEHIIERALVQIDGRIALDDLRSLMEGAGFVQRGDGDQNQTVH
jgi:Smg protein